MSSPQLNVVTEGPETKPAGLALPCPKCGEAEASIDLRLSDLDTCTCAECGTEFTLDEVREFIARWSAVLGWVATFPAA